MIKVYVRHENEFEGQFLGEFMTTDLPQLIHSFGVYDTFFVDEGKTVENGGVMGQYISDAGVYFEILVSPK